MNERLAQTQALFTLNAFAAPSVFSSIQEVNADINCHGISTHRNPNPVHLAVLIDTGAHYLELPNRVANELGLNLAP